ncbi:MAG: folate-binding protein, partial [Proteobacteria bacterium]|nr:folate-binding protein [Pseudomonadota bacterium]
PHMLNLDLLGAISLDKGCYTGQEIVARTYYKGATKRRTLHFASEAPLDTGDKVSLDGRDVGEVLNVAGNELLAVVPLDVAEKDLVAGEAPLARLPLPYLAGLT